VIQSEDKKVFIYNINIKWLSIYEVDRLQYCISSINMYKMIAGTFMSVVFLLGELRLVCEMNESLFICLHKLSLIVGDDGQKLLFGNACGLLF